MRYEIKTTDGVLYLTSVDDVFDYAETLAETAGVDTFDVEETRIIGIRGNRTITLGSVVVVDYFA